MRMVSFSGVAELNLAFLYFVREALLKDRLLALTELEIDAGLANLILAMTADQLIRLSQSELLLVGLRWRKTPVWHCLNDYAAGADAALPRALIAAESLSDGQQA
jgi:hypothetical protein